MRLRSKFIGLYALIFISVLTIVSVSLQTQRNILAISEAVTVGNQILEQSRRVRQITKDVMFASFAPESYSSLKDILYFDSYPVALRNWSQESQEFMRLFSLFMNNPVLLDLVDRGILRDEYDTALIMSEKAFEKLKGLQNRVENIQKAGLLGEDLYIRIQRSSDPDLIALFDETRQTSYYLANSFESYLTYFTEALTREVDTVRSDLLGSFLLLGIGTAFGITLVTLIFASRIVGRLRILGEALRRVSVGDFSTPLIVHTGDEFHDLALNFNKYTDILKANLSSLVSLARRVTEEALPAERSGQEREAQNSYDPVDQVLSSVVRGCLAKESGEGAVLVVHTPQGPQLRFNAPAHTLWPWEEYLPVLSALENGGAPCVFKDGRTDSGSILAGPLGVAGRRFGVLAVFSMERNFNDLDLIRFENYLEFAGLLADNAATYAELLEERSAEYLTLQSQVRPHFMFNVLGGFAALNHMEARETLAESILALKELLRYTVDHASQTTVRDELSFIRRYCELQHMRFQHRLSWTIEEDEKLLDHRIPKLILHPLVENAIIHGIEPKAEGGCIRISVNLWKEDAAILQLTVEDDGVGFDLQKTERGVGIRNIERRLALLDPATKHARKGQLYLDSSPGSGTRAQLFIPMDLPCEF